MKNLAISTVFLCLLISSAQAQTWSVAEKEVIKDMADFYQLIKDQNTDAILASFHDDYVGFRIGMPTTVNKADRHKSRLISQGRLIEYWVKPLAIRFVGDVVIVHYFLYTVTENKDGERQSSRNRETDIMVKEEGKWLLIADSGGSDEQ